MGRPVTMMRPRTALCGQAAAHDPHPLARVLDDRQCGGLTVQDAAAGELWRILHKYVRDAAGSRQPLPGATLIAHPSIRNCMLRGLDADFCSYPDDPEVFPPELPVIWTTSLALNEWRLVTISLVSGGVMP